MKSGKSYFFTNDEILTLRNALIEYHQFIKTLKPNSSIAIKNKKNAKALSDQFKQDTSLTR